MPLLHSTLLQLRSPLLPSPSDSPVVPSSPAPAASPPVSSPGFPLIFQCHFPSSLSIHTTFPHQLHLRNQPAGSFASAVIAEAFQVPHRQLNFCEWLDIEIGKSDPAKQPLRSSHKRKRSQRSPSSRSKSIPPFPPSTTEFDQQDPLSDPPETNCNSYFTTKTTNQFSAKEYEVTITIGNLIGFNIDAKNPMLRAIHGNSGEKVGLQ
ncbi:unnamed protein product [Lactuca saligna]|uniref:Uncharacterized protein n=1 Tax=Lactuca saligna TaxID=75948 RepID=A0AA35ZCD7_LACSI|nr:unnamed protein product [Lactuca saligna]